MKYLLDTNVCIVYLNGRNTHLRNKLYQSNPNDIVLCSIVKAELFFGAMRSRNPQDNLLKQKRFLSQFKSLPFDDKASGVFGIIRAELAFKGTPIGPYDLMIAAIAKAHNLTLITHNIREFKRIDNLQIEDWGGGSAQ